MDHSSYRSLAKQQLDEALTLDEIREGLESVAAYGLSQDNIRNRIRRDIDKQVPATRDEIEAYFRARKRALPNGDRKRRLTVPTPSLDRCINTLAAVAMIGTFILADDRTNALLAWSSVVLMLLGLILGEVAPLPSSRRLRIQAILFGLGIASGLSAIVSIQKLAKDQVSSDDIPEMLIAALICLALALPFSRRKSDHRQIPSGIVNPPLRIDTVAPLIIFLMSSLSIATIFLLGIPRNRAISFVSIFGGVTLPLFEISSIAITAAALHCLSTITLQSNAYLIEDLQRTESIARRTVSSQDVLPAIRELINSATRKLTKEYRVGRAPGLSEAFDPLFEVSTKAQERVVDLLQRMPGGAIGLAGSRGVGKTTLINAICRQTRPNAGTSLSPPSRLLLSTLHETSF